MDTFRTLAFDPPGPWLQAGHGRFHSVAPGVLETEGGPGALWYAPETFADFILEVDWRTTTPEDNSGIFLRFPKTELQKPEPDWKASLEVQIDDRGVDHEHHRQHSPLHLTGALYLRSPARTLASRPLGAWNLFRIEARGAHVRVALNGVEVCTWQAEPTLPRAGHLGLQNHHPGSRVQFRAPRLLLPGT